MKQIISITLCLTIASTCTAKPLQVDEWQQPYSDQSVSFGKYTSVLNCEKKTPRYVYYNLLPEYFEGDEERKGWWSNITPDSIKSICGESYAKHNDYKKTGYSRGHLNPSDNYDSDQEDMKATFNFANIAPQNGSFNGGLWKTIENKERNLAVEHNGITVITGVIHKGSTQHIKNDISVPVYFYKIILWKDGRGIHNMAWLVENDKPDKGIKPDDVLVDYQVIEDITGLDFID